ncbi:OmpA family protein [Flavobacterium sp. PL11]|uniref:OmpA family protein n=1 Tax=Flavobacterium sp. PL11 TaxID=3071717 RepID=UPI002E141F19
MKKIITLCLVGLSAITAAGQEIRQENQMLLTRDNTNPREKEKNYNRWSVNLNGGVNVPVGPFSTGFSSANTNYFKNPNFNHIDFNVRKMFNTKFGLMLDFGYEKFAAQSRSLPFTNRMYTTSLQGVLNVHRALNWEEFTNTFGLQLHFGPGLAFLDSNVTKANAANTSGSNANFDNIYSVVSGARLLIKASDRLAFNVNYTLNKNFSHHVTIDGTSTVNLTQNRTGTVHSAAVGLTLYLGSKEKHADWYWENKVEKTDELLARINKLESQLSDGNKDGFPDIWENYLNGKVNNANVVNNNFEGDQNYSNAEALAMINSQYVNVFFDFDKSTISTGTISAINFLIKYLNSNPEANVEVIGYADELGNFDYNMRLSERRAKNVAEMIERSGISASRLKVVVKGEDNSVPKESTLARQLVRRVVFKVN